MEQTIFSTFRLTVDPGIPCAGLLAILAGKTTATITDIELNIPKAFPMLFGNGRSRLENVVMDFINLLMKLSSRGATANVEKCTGLLTHLDMSKLFSVALGTRF